MQTVTKWLGWMMMLSLLSLTGCGLLGEKKSAGSFCDVYTVVDMPREQAARIDQPYRGRILANERWESGNCPR